jgi:hypothetical protein
MCALILLFIKKITLLDTSLTEEKEITQNYVNGDQILAIIT